MRTLVAAPKALLLDEPFSKFDSELRREIRNFVFDRAIANRLPVLLVTHDSSDAKAASGTTVN
jgi:putative thiamine transport system ATP-binding protein